MLVGSGWWAGGLLCSSLPTLAADVAGRGGSDGRERTPLWNFIVVDISIEDVQGRHRRRISRLSGADGGEGCYVS